MRKFRNKCKKCTFRILRLSGFYPLVFSNKYLKKFKLIQGNVKNPTISKRAVKNCALLNKGKRLSQLFNVTEIVEADPEMKIRFNSSSNELSKVQEEDLEEEEVDDNGDFEEKSIKIKTNEDESRKIEVEITLLLHEKDAAKLKNENIMKALRDVNKKVTKYFQDMVNECKTIENIY